MSISRPDLKKSKFVGQFFSLKSNQTVLTYSYLSLTLLGTDGGISGKVTAFCPGCPGSNPTMDLGFFQFRIAVNLFWLGVGLFLITCNRTVHTLTSSYLFPRRLSSDLKKISFVI